MTLVLLGVGVMLFCLPRWLGPLARLLHPRERVRVSLAALLCGATVLELGLVLLSLPAVLDSLGNQALASACRRLLGDLAPGGLRVGWSALALAFLLPLLAVRSWARSSALSEQMRVEPSLGTHRYVDGINVVHLPTQTVLAYSIDGLTPQIVVSDGLAELLTPVELDAVVGHEAAHITERHGRTLRALTALETALPPMRWSTQAVRVAIERCADEVASDRDRGRRLALIDALARVGGLEIPAGAMPFVQRSGVLERVEALLVPPPAPTTSQRLAARAIVAGAGVLGVAVVGAWVYEAHMMASMVGVCHM